MISAIYLQFEPQKVDKPCRHIIQISNFNKIYECGAQNTAILAHAMGFILVSRRTLR